MVWKKTKNILMNQHSLINFCLEKGLFFTFVASYHVGFASLNPGTLAHFLRDFGRHAWSKSQGISARNQCNNNTE